MNLKTDLSQKVTFSPGANVKSLNLKAGDLDGDDALEDQVEVHLGSHGHLLQQADLDLQGDAGTVLHQDGEWSNGHHIKCDWFGTSI